MNREYKVEIVRDEGANSVAIFLICEQDDGNCQKRFVLVGRHWREMVRGYSEPTMLLYGNDVIGNDLFVKLIEALKSSGLVKLLSLEKFQKTNYFNDGDPLLLRDEMLIESEIQIKETWKGKIPEGRKLIMEVEKE